MNRTMVDTGEWVSAIQRMIIEHASGLAQDAGHEGAHPDWEAATAEILRRPWGSVRAGELVLTLDSGQHLVITVSVELL